MRPSGGHKNTGGRKRLGFVTSAFLPERDQTSSFDFFAILTSQVVQCLQQEYDVVIRVPGPAEANNSGQSQEKLLSELLAEASSFDGYIVSPFDVHTIAPEIVKFLKNTNSIPLITIDQSLESSHYFRKHQVKIPRAVVPNNRQGGECAARALWEYYESIPREHRQTGKPKFIVVQGTGASPVRYDGFKKEIDLLSRKKARVVPSGELPFSRDSASDWVQRQIQDNIDAWKDVVGIFACNDELALGVCDALDWHLTNPRRKHFIKAAVVGFDGLRDVAGRIEKPDELWLINSVEVPISAMARTLAQVVKASLSGSRVSGSKTKIMVKCELIKDPKKKQTKFETLFTRRREWAKAFSIKPRPDVVAITIKLEEEQAVIKRLKNRDQHFGTHRTYQIGDIHRTDKKILRIAVVRPSEQGVGNAQDVTRDAIEDLNPKLIVLVGIGGGKPAPEYGLGDVIVCTRVRDLTMGAYIWDPIRAVSTRQFVDSGGPMDKNVEVLITALSGLDRQLKGWNSTKSIQSPQPPVSVESKKFYGVKHIPDLKKLITDRFIGKECRQNPIFYPGSIASDGNLVKDAAVIEEWTKVARDFVAIDMELPGVFRSAYRREKQYPILAIRGISDVIGFKRDHAWTKYACETAAAFFVHLLRVHPELSPDGRFFSRL